MKSDKHGSPRPAQAAVVDRGRVRVPQRHGVEAITHQTVAAEGGVDWWDAERCYWLLEQTLPSVDLTIGRLNRSSTPPSRVCHRVTGGVVGTTTLLSAMHYEDSPFVVYQAPKAFEQPTDATTQSGSSSR